MSDALRICAHLAGEVAIQNGRIELDALLAWATFQRADEGREVLPEDDLRSIDIPIDKATGGRFHLCSSSVQRFEEHSVRYVNRRFPIEEAQMMGDAKLRRINLAGGPTKSYRIPLSVGHLVGDQIEWWCVGEADDIRTLLAWIGYLGKKRSAGLGRVHQWEVDTCEPWAPGFPIVREGRPMRPLPPDWPGLITPTLAEEALTYPYWHPARRCVVAVPC